MGVIPRQVHSAPKELYMKYKLELSLTTSLENAQKIMSQISDDSITKFVLEVVPGSKADSFQYMGELTGKYMGRQVLGPKEDASPITLKVGHEYLSPYGVIHHISSIEGTKLSYYSKYKKSEGWTSEHKTTVNNFLFEIKDEPLELITEDNQPIIERDIVIEEVEQPAKRYPPRKKTHRAKAGEPTLRVTVLEATRNPTHVKDIIKAVVRNGFAKNSATAEISRLCRIGKVKRIGEAVYQRA